jgi:hypothetical protein
VEGAVTFVEVCHIVEGDTLEDKVGDIVAEGQVQVVSWMMQIDFERTFV